MRHLAPSRVREYYLDCIDQALDDLGVPRDPLLSAYLGDILARYAFRIDVQPASVSETLAAIRRCWDIDGDAFDPGREVTLRREVGDAVLFLTGFAWERVASRRARRHLVRTGRDAYRFLAEYHRAADNPRQGLVFRALSRRFARYSVVLMYVREVYLDVDRERSVGSGESR